MWTDIEMDRADFLILMNILQTFAAVTTALFLQREIFVAAFVLTLFIKKKFGVPIADPKPCCIYLNFYCKIIFDWLLLFFA